MEEDEVPETPLGEVSSKKKSPIESNIEEIGISSSFVETFVVETTIILDDSTKVSTPEHIVVTLPEDSLTK